MLSPEFKADLENEKLKRTRTLYLNSYSYPFLEMYIETSSCILHMYKITGYPYQNEPRRHMEIKNSCAHSDMLTYVDIEQECKHISQCFLFNYKAMFCNQESNYG